MFESLDQAEGAHVFGMFPQAVTADAAGYCAAVIEALRTQLDVVDKVRVAEGNPAWPALPPECFDPRSPPSRRLRAAIAHAASLVPGGHEHHMVFCLLPQTIGKPEAYAQAISALLPAPQTPNFRPEPAWPRVRLILRDQGAQPQVIEALRRLKAPDVLVYEPDLSPDALMDATVRDVADPNLPEAQRMQMLVELASLDYAHGRLEDAVAKYGVLYDYYRKNNVPSMQAFILQGTGDVLRKLGRLPMARERYGQGLTMALETKTLPLITTLAYSAGDVSLELGRFEDAEAHLDIARQIAAGLRNRPVEADALEKLGIARLALKRPGDAIVAWRDAANACRASQYRERLISVLDRMAKVFASARMTADERAAQSELTAVRAGAPIKAPPVAAPVAAGGPGKNSTERPS
jgi:tetratricopeptide (TPR) repeat protein